jgi:hypothetical protein
MEEILDRAREEAPGPAGPPEKASGPAEGGSWLRAASEAVAVVSASALVGGGTGMLAGTALGAINPYGLGMVGAVMVTCVSVPLTLAALKR